MKQLLFCYKENRKLLIRHNILTDVFVPIQDIISPQKTTLKIPKTDRVELNDIVIIRDNDSGFIEYIGYIDTLVNKEITEISCYPIINTFDNDFVLDKMFKTVKKGSYNESGQWEESETETEDVEVDIIEWLISQIDRAFISTDDDYQAIPFKIRNLTTSPVLYKKILDTSNLFECYLDIFINTGVYIEFSELSYYGNQIDGIYCDIRCNKQEKVHKIYWNNPNIQNVDIVDNTFTNYNKIIATEKLAEGVTREPQRYYFYLLDNNDITREPKDSVRLEKEQDENLPIGSLGRRIKQVRSKEISFDVESGDTSTDEEKASALLLAVYNELQAPEYNLKIEIEIFKDGKKYLHKRVDFVAESGIIYTSNVTKVENLNDKQIKITLGALRNSLTDFKKKVEEI